MRKIIISGSMLAAAVFALSLLPAPPNGQAFLTARNCAIAAKELIVRGDSLRGLIADGTPITVEYGYFGCHPIRRGDIVLYNFPGQQEPIIKIVKAIPGDLFELVKNGDHWNIVINGRVVRNSVGEIYRLDRAAHGLLSLYAVDYGNRIPAEAYLILGNVPTGSLDSTRFGLIHRDEIMGRVR